MPHILSQGANWSALRRGALAAAVLGATAAFFSACGDNTTVDAPTVPPSVSAADEGGQAVTNGGGIARGTSGCGTPTPNAVRASPQASGVAGVAASGVATAPPSPSSASTPSVTPTPC